MPENLDFMAINPFDVNDLINRHGLLFTCKRLKFRFDMKTCESMKMNSLKVLEFELKKKKSGLLYF